MSKKLIKLPILLTPILAISLSVSSCSFFGFNNSLSVKIITEVERKQENNMKYISQRSFSLKFYEKSTGSYTYGTGWIFAKDNDDKDTPTNYCDDTYYIATNLHVAAALQNRKKTAYEVSTAKSVTYVDYNQLLLGVVSEDNGVTSGTNYTIESNTYTYYNSYIDLTDNDAVSIAYTTFDIFNNMNNGQGLFDLTNSYHDNNIKNGTMDLAILKIDFSKIKPVANKTNSLVEQNIDAYIANPTTFAKDGYTENQSVTIAGYPYNKEDGQTNGAGQWSSAYKSPARQLANKTNITNGYSASYTNKANNKWLNGVLDQDKHSDELIRKNYVLSGDIAFNYNDYAGYRNLAKQAMFYNVLLTSGSSGSMAINDNNEVVGIYWGAYKTATDGSIGSIDSFVNNVVYKTKSDISWSTPNVTILEEYNIFDDFNNKIPNTNLNNKELNLIR